VRASIPTCITDGVKVFLERGKKRLSSDTQHEVTTDEVLLLRRENEDLKKMLGETLKYE
jgi:hypothetical protein